MKIETKYNPGDEIYYMKDNQIVNQAIYGISIKVIYSGSNIGYKTITEYDMNSNGVLYEHQIFKTKEALLKSL